MKGRIRGILICAVICLAICFQTAVPVRAMVSGGNREETVPEKNSESSVRLFDEAMLFSQTERKTLEELIAQCRSRMGMDVVVVTAFQNGQNTAEEYADDFYDQGGFGTGKEASGVLFLLYMDGPGQSGGEFRISTSGNMIRILTDSRLEAVEKHVADNLRERDFAGGVRVFLEDVAGYAAQGIETGQYNYDRDTGEISIHRSVRWYEALFALAVSLFTAGSVCLSIKNSYRMKQSDRQQANSLLAYRAQSAFRFADSRDQLVNQYVTSVPIPRPVKVSGGGRGPSGGGFSGQSTTHRSGGGRSHGGGGGRF